MKVTGYGTVVQVFAQEAFVRVVSLDFGAMHGKEVHIVRSTLEDMEVVDLTDRVQIGDYVHFSAECSQRFPRPICTSVEVVKPSGYTYVISDGVVAAANKVRGIVNVEMHSQWSQVFFSKPALIHPPGFSWCSRLDEMFEKGCPVRLKLVLAQGKEETEIYYVASVEKVQKVLDEGFEAKVESVNDSDNNNNNYTAKQCTAISHTAGCTRNVCIRGLAIRGRLSGGSVDTSGCQSNRASATRSVGTQTDPFVVDLAISALRSVLQHPDVGPCAVVDLYQQCPKLVAAVLTDDLVLTTGY